MTYSLFPENVVILTHNWTMSRQWKTLEYSASNKISKSNLYPQSSGSYSEEEGKDFGRQRWWMSPRKQCLPDTKELIHTWTHSDNLQKTVLAQNRQNCSTEQGMGKQSSTLNQEPIYNCYILGKKPVFSNKVSLGIFYIPGQDPCPQVVGQHKTEPKNPFSFVHFLLFCWGFFFPY